MYAFPYFFFIQHEFYTYLSVRNNVGGGLSFIYNISQGGTVILSGPDGPPVTSVTSQNSELVGQAIY